MRRPPNSGGFSGGFLDCLTCLRFDDGGRGEDEKLRRNAPITEPNSRRIPGRGESRLCRTETSRRPKTQRHPVERISEPVGRFHRRDSRLTEFQKPDHVGCRHEGKIPKKTPLSLANLFPPFLFSSREMGPAEQRQRLKTRRDLGESVKSKKPQPVSAGCDLVT